MMNNQKDIYSLFLNLISVIGAKETLKSIYNDVDKFFKENLDGSICAFSLDIDKAFNLDKVRLYTSKKQFTKKKKLILKYYKEMESQKNSDSKKEKNIKLIKIYNYGHQTIFCLFEFNSNFNILIDYLVEFLNSHHQRIKQLNEIKDLKKLSDTDEITGLSNQRKLKSDIKFLISKYEKTHETFSLLFIDIDKYKEVNDGHGHVVGTELLNQLGIVLKDTIRESDFLYRYGGDEFVVIIHDIDEDTAEFVANRFLNIVREKTFVVNDINFRLSVSIGIASYPIHASNETEILEIADKMMYEAKKNGRGIVCSAKDLI